MAFERRGIKARKKFSLIIESFLIQPENRAFVQFAASGTLGSNQTLTPSRSTCACVLFHYSTFTGAPPAKLFTSE